MSVWGDFSGWRSQDPGQYMLDVVKAAGSFGDSFAKGMQSGQQDKQQTKQLSQQGQQFRDKFIEEQRQFNILHPDPTKPWNTSPITAPPVSAPPPQTPSPGGNFSSPDWNTSPTFGMEGFEDGGRPPVDQPSIVGEAGPEVFVPDKPGTIVPNNQIGMAYDRNGTGQVTPTGITSTSSVGDGVAQKSGAGWNGEQKPNWLNAPAPNWRATNALDAIGKVTQAKTFDDLTAIQAANPEAGMYPQFQDALHQKSLVLQRGAEIELRQKAAENNSVAAKSALDLNKRFNDQLLALPDSFQVAVRALGDGARNKDGTPSPAAMGILEAGKQYQEVQIAEKAKAAKLVPTRMDEKGKTVYGTPPVGSDGAEVGVKTFYDENGQPAFRALMQGTLVKHSTPIGEHVPPEVKAQQDNNKTQINATQKQLSAQLRVAQSTSATDADKRAAAEAVVGLRADLQKLADEHIRLSTNWMSKGSAPAAPTAAQGTNAVAATVPSDPAQRKAGTVYPTPKGNLKWTGTGWLQP